MTQLFSTLLSNTSTHCLQLFPVPLAYSICLDRYVCLTVLCVHSCMHVACDASFDLARPRESILVCLQEIQEMLRERLYAIEHKPSWEYKALAPIKVPPPLLISLNFPAANEQDTELLLSPFKLLLSPFKLFTKVSLLVPMKEVCSL